MRSLLLLPVLVLDTLAQVSLPSPPWLPPNASAGAQSSSGFPNPQWSTLLGNGLYFYEAQRSGQLPSTNRVSWRNSSALKDGSDAGLDLTGGYYDAGDYIKATYPFTWAVASTCWGAMDYGKGYDLANQTAYLDDMLRWSLDWLIKAHPNNSTLYVLVGSTDVDNAYWGGDQGIPSDRPSYQINDTSPGTDAAAMASAAFSACASLYSNSTSSTISSNSTTGYPGPASLQNQTYSDALLTHAQQLYTLAVNATGGHTTYQNSVPAIADAYASSSFQDELTLAALLLSQATNSSQLYQDAVTYYSRFGLAAVDTVLNWDSKGPALPVLFAQLVQSGLGIGGNLTGWQKDAETYFDRIVNGDSKGYLTKGGLLFYPGDSDEASLNPAMNAAMLMFRYAPLASTSDKMTAYTTFALNQLDYAMGNNPMSAAYVVGANPNSPQNPHSAMASGGSDINSIDTSPPQEAYVLYGAVPGGPNVHDRFWDIRSDWPETEVALDYNSPLLTLAAMQVANSTAVDPYYTRLQVGAYTKPGGGPCDAALSCKSGLSKAGKIAIAVVVTVVGLAIVGLGAYWILLWRRRHTLKVY